MKRIAMILVMGVAAWAADANGKWTAVFDTQIGEQKYTYEFKVTGKKLTGKASNGASHSEIQEGRIDGDTITFVENFDYQGSTIRIEYTGQFDGDDRIKFTRKVAEFAVEEIVASRVK